MKKRIVVCLDGTWNSPDKGKEDTNVEKIYKMLPTQADQITGYFPGVGTKDTVDKFTGGLFGVGVSDNIKLAYEFIAKNYNHGDELYIFGFSRGAFSARSLAGLIGVSGIPKEWDSSSGTKAWSFYRLGQQKRKSTRRGRKLGDFLQTACLHNIPIACVSVWDTVGALGIPSRYLNWIARSKFAFHDTQLGDLVENALHAIAIDEKRRPFAPTFWTAAPGDVDKFKTKVQQVWFAGVHSNIGGSYEDTGLSDITLKWMIEEVRKRTDLLIDETRLNKTIAPDHLATLYDTKWYYFASKLKPAFRILAGRDFEGADSNRYPSEEGLVVLEEKLHHSVKERYEKLAKYLDEQQIYHPKNLKAAINHLEIVT